MLIPIGLVRGLANKSLALEDQEEEHHEGEESGDGSKGGDGGNNSMNSSMAIKISVSQLPEAERNVSAGFNLTQNVDDVVDEMMRVLLLCSRATLSMISGHVLVLVPQ